MVELLEHLCANEMLGNFSGSRGNMENLELEIWDPIHNFVKLSPSEAKILDSLPLQRLRDINQLGLTYLVYPSATNKRFEHSIGVMELASRVFDVITNINDIHQPEIIKEYLPEIMDKNKCTYWLQVLRLAALCHDVGHLPFSHAGEDLMPNGWNHERMTAEIIREELAPLFTGFDDLPRSLEPEDVVKVALGFEEYHKINKTEEFSNWETILGEIITGDAFGVDRMDYLLRDSYHVGVPYGKIDYLRLIDCLRVLFCPQFENPSLGIEKSGLHVAETLLLSRYYMFSQVYLHRVRRVYDFHLKEFLKPWLEKKWGEPFFSIKTKDFLRLCDSEIMIEIMVSTNGHAKRIRERNHYREVYERSCPVGEMEDLEPEKSIYEELKNEFGKDNVVLDDYEKKGGIQDFPVLTRDERTVNAGSLTQILNKIPSMIKKIVFINPDYRNKAEELVNQKIGKTAKGQQ